MSKPDNDFFTKEIVYKIDGMQNILIKKDIKYTNSENGESTIDIYYPENTELNKLKSAVIFVTGYPDLGFKEITGYKLKEIGQYISWAKLIAASGLIAVTYTNSNPDLDINILLKYILDNNELLGIDKEKIGIWACSGNTPNALSVLMNEENNFIKCAVLCYGYMPDIAESTITSDAAKQFHFVNPLHQLSMDNFFWKNPMLIVRAGHDAMPGLNASIDGFISSALAHNFPFSFVNVSDAPHAFDITEHTECSRNAIKSILLFLKLNLINDGELI